MTRLSLPTIVLAAGALTLACAREGDDASTSDTANDSAAVASTACMTGTPTITAGGVGPVRVGAPLSDVQARCTVRDTSFSLGEGLMEDGRVIELDGASVVVLTGADGRVTRIIVEDPTLQTERGLRVGSTVGDLRRTHGQLCAAVGEGIVVVSSGNLGPISFATDADLRLVRRGGSIDAEAIPDDARLTSLWVYEGRALCGAS